jgi:hypothetical protein
MKLVELFTGTRDSLVGERVYADPFEVGGVTVIPAASVWGGAGGADGQDGTGGGFGLTARPTGAYVVKDGRVSWKPALDVNRLVLTVGVIVIIGLFIGSRMARRRRERDQD